MDKSQEKNKRRIQRTLFYKGQLEFGGVKEVGWGIFR